jgi:hypothetical protein
MTPEQEQAGTQLLRALNVCRAVGLAGGVFDGSFCIWPQHIDPLAGEFFEVIEGQGRRLLSSMSLDGGAGI